MSIISGRTDSLCAQRTRTQEPDENVRKLLDHIAAELAEEYVRLMEAAAAADGSGVEQDVLPQFAVRSER